MWGPERVVKCYFLLDIRAGVCYNGNRTMEKFVNFRDVLTPVGVYILLLQGTVVYVGKSKNVFARLSKHWTNMVRYRKGLPMYGGHESRKVILFDDVEVKFCAVDELDREEIGLIQKHLPQHNNHHCVERYDLRHIPAFQELLARAKKRQIPNYLRRDLGTITKTKPTKINGIRPL
jgi:hypothetical protein